MAKRKPSSRKAPAPKRKGPPYPFCPVHPQMLMSYITDFRRKKGVVVWWLEGCADCRKENSVRNDEVKMSAGGAWRIRAYDEIGTPHIVEVSAKVAARAVYLGRVHYIEEQPCAIFKDEVTGEVYAQPYE